MSGLQTRTVRVNGEACRVWEKGSGVPLVFLAGWGGLPTWPPFLEALAAHRRVVVPSLPGFPGAKGHDRLDHLIDWVAATLDLVEGIDLCGADMMGASVGATLLAETAALSPGFARRLILAAPFGLFDPVEPVADPWAQPPGSMSHLASDAARLRERFAAPAEANAVEWQVEQARALEAAALLLWPTTDTGLARRLHRIRMPTLILWGERDALIPPGYSKRLAAQLGGETELLVVPGAGHLVELDAPEACAKAVLGFCDR